MKTIKRKLSDYFDKVYILNMAHRKDRKDFLIKQLKTIGIYDDLVNTDTLEWVETVKLPITQKALDCMYLSGDIDFKYADNSQLVGQFMCASEHYRMIKRSYVNGYKRILILEDDVCFLKDFSIFMKALDEAPDDFKVLHLEGFYWPYNDSDKQVYLEQMSKSIDEAHWISSQNFKLYCTAALIYSTDGMKEYCEIQETKFISPDHPTFWMTNKCFAYNYPLVLQEDKQALKSDIYNYVGDSGDVNVYLTYCDKTKYYHYKDFSE